MTVQNPTLQAAQATLASPTASIESKQRAAGTIAMVELIGDGSDLTGSHFTKLDMDERAYLKADYPLEYERLRSEADRVQALARIEARPILGH